MVSWIPLTLADVPGANRKIPSCSFAVGEHGRGAKWEQTYALNGPKSTPTALNEPALTCGNHISAGQRDMTNIVHTYELLQLSSTDLNCIKPQVNSRERPSYGPQCRGELFVLRKQNQTVVRSDTSVRFEPR